VKIDSNKLTSPLTGEVAGDNRTTRGPAPAKEGSTPSVDVQVSSLGSRLQAIEEQLRTGDGVDAAKVAEIRQAIAEGRLQIRPEVIADRLLETVRELLRGQSGSS
jgi:negative regulator of flagellin synthesis FlgM